LIDEEPVPDFQDQERTDSAGVVALAGGVVVEDFGDEFWAEIAAIGGF
jgi:hypothetical protein